MDKQTFDSLSPKESAWYLAKATPEQIDELFRNGALEQVYYDMIREIRGIMPADRARELEIEDRQAYREMGMIAP